MRTTIRPLINLFLFTAIAVSVAQTPSPAQQPGGERIRDQDSFTSTNLLSPGTHDDWPLKAREGETVMIYTSSRNFDPMIELIDPTDRVVAQNDDVRPGRRDSLLLARLSSIGDYQVRVSSSNAAAGGEYELTVRRFIPSDLAIGTRATSLIGKSFASWKRLDADAGQTLVLTARASRFKPIVQIFAPNGESMETESAGDAARDSVKAIFRTAQAGAYFIRIATPTRDDPRESYTVTVARGREFPITIGAQNQERRIEAGGLDLYPFHGDAGDVIRVRAKAAEAATIARLSYIPPADATNQTRIRDDQVPPFVLLPTDPKANGEIIALLNATGTYQIAVTRTIEYESLYTLITDRPAKTLAPDAETTAEIGIAESAYWTVEGTPGAIVRFAATSDRFDTELELYAPEGSLIARNDDDATGRGSMLTAFLTDRGRYILRLHSHGEGGGGAYRLRQVPNPVRALAIGERGEGIVGEGGSEVWSFAGRGGRTVIASARATGFKIKMSIYTSDGTEIAYTPDNGQAFEELLSTRLPADGTYTIWISAVARGGRFSLQLFEAR